MENYSVQVPSYTVGPEAYRQIEKQCHIYGKKAVVVGGKKAMAAAKDKLLAAVKDTGIEILDFVWFGGECTFNNAKVRTVRGSTAGRYDICCWWRKGN